MVEAVFNRQGNALHGIGFMVLGTCLFAIMDAMVKWLSAEYSIAQVVFFRSLFAFVPLSVLLLRTSRPLHTTRPLAHLLRSLIGVTAMGCFFYAFSQLPLTEVTAISFSASLIMTALSVPLLGEKVGGRRWAAIAIGFAGVLLILRPTGAPIGLGSAAALVATFLYACTIIAIRSLGRTEKSVTTVFYFTLTSTIAGGALLPWSWRTPTPTDALLFVGVGLLGGTAQMCMTQAARLAPVATIAPFDYLQMLFAVVIGYVVWGHVPAAATLSGAAIIIAAALYILHRETLAKQRDGITLPAAPKPPASPAADGPVAARRGHSSPAQADAMPD